MSVADTERTCAEIVAEIDQLRSEHGELERRLEELHSHVYLTPAEQAEEAAIKKNKLLKKDKIFALQRTVEQMPAD